MLKIKEKYYSEILAQFKREVDKCPEIEGDFKEEFFLISYIPFSINTLVKVEVFILQKLQIGKECMKKYILTIGMWFYSGKPICYIM